jgi:hypothetical protein
MKRSHIIILGVLAVIVFLGIGRVLWTFLAVDDCLDAGGRWSDAGVCESRRDGG